MAKKKNLDLAPSRKDRMGVGQIILLILLLAYTVFCAAPIWLTIVSAFTDEEIARLSLFFRHTDYVNDNINYYSNIDSLNVSVAGGILMNNIH